MGLGSGPQDARGSMAHSVAEAATGSVALVALGALGVRLAGAGAASMLSPWIRSSGTSVTGGMVGRGRNGPWVGVPAEPPGDGALGVEVTAPP